MQLYFYMCSNFNGVKDVQRLVEIMLENDLVLSGRPAKTPDGKLGINPYEGSVSSFVETVYHDREYKNASEIVNSFGPHFNFQVITKLGYSTYDIPRYDYITVRCVGFMLGQNYNYVSAAINFHTFESPDYESPYFEDGVQLMRKLGMEFYDYLQPWYGWLDYDQHDFLSFEAISERKELDTLYWANFYGPQYIEKYGLNTFQKSPCWKKEELPDGGIYLQLSEYFTKPVSGKEKWELQEYFSPYGVSLSYGNPFEEEYNEV